MVVLAICCLSLLVVSMDATIVNVSLPAIRRELGASLSGLQWVVDSYTIVLASFLMLGGSTADRYGRKRVFQIGMVLFASGSLMCSMSTTVAWLIAARVMQALGGSMLNPVAMAIIVHTFPEPRDRAKAIGIWGAVAGLALALGPLAGGTLTQIFGWHAIFWINLPVCGLALLLTAIYIPESRAAHPRRPDPVGQFLLLMALASLIYSLIEGAQAANVVAGSMAFSVTAFLALLVYESRRAEPLVDLRFFRSLPFSSATLIAVCMFASMGSFLFLGSIFLQEVYGLSPFHSGLCFLPMATAVMVVSPLSGRLVGARGARPSLLVSGSMLCLSAFLMTRLDAGSPLVMLVLIYFVFGLGFGMVNAPVTYAAVSGMPRAQAGLAAAIASTSRQVGMALGVAMVGALIGSARYVEGGDVGQFLAATHLVWWTLAGGGVLIFCLGLLSTGAWARASVERCAHLLQEPESKP